MSCKHRVVNGNTTKYFYCSLKNKSIDEYSCKDCLLRIEDNTNNQIKDVFEQIFGKGFSGK